MKLYKVGTTFLCTIIIWIVESAISRTGELADISNSPSEIIVVRPVHDYSDKTILI